MKGKHALYRHFDRCGELLYIGISCSFLQRTLSHSINSEWFSDVARIDVEWFESKKEASAAEMAAIGRENPKYNIARPEKVWPRPRPYHIEKRRLEILAEGFRLGVKLNRGSCLSVLESELKNGKEQLEEKISA